MAANPMREPGAFNVFRVAGVPLPGIAIVTGCVDESKLDVKSGKGTKGASVNYEGSDPKEFTVTLLLFEEEEYDEWLDGNARRVLLTPPEGKEAKAFAVDHPSCLECNITSALKKSVSAAEPQGDGSYRVTIKLQPAPPPKPSSGTPSGTAAKPAWQQAPAQSEADAAIDELTKQVQALAA